MTSGSDKWLGRKWGSSGAGADSEPLSTVSSGISSDTTTLGLADVYEMTVAGTTLTIQSADITEGRVFIIRAVTASMGTPVTVATEGSETIDGAATIDLTTDFSSVTLQATGGELRSIG